MISQDDLISINKNFVYRLEDKDINVFQILVNEKSGVSSGRIYKYRDDDSSSYIASIFVNYDNRLNGYGNQIIKLLEDISILLRSKYCYLQVINNSWMYEWYKRKGYINIINNFEDPDYIWMRKSLN